MKREILAAVISNRQKYSSYSEKIKKEKLGAVTTNESNMNYSDEINEIINKSIPL